MKRKTIPFLGLAMMMAAAEYDKKIFDTGPSKVYAKKITKQDSPRWEINGQIIFAKDEKTAIKYAKKRGLWQSGAIVKPIK